MKTIKVKMNKPVYLAISMLDISKTLMYEFWYDYIKPKFGDRAKLCYMDTDNFVIYIKLKIFMKTLQMMLKDGLIHLTIMKIKLVKDRFQYVKTKK